MSKLPFSDVSVYFAALATALTMPTVGISAPRHLGNSIIVVADERASPKEFYISLPLQGYQNRYIGDFEMCVKIFLNRAQGYVSIWNHMPDSDQYLVISVAPLHEISTGKLTFKFTDGVDNEGIGSIEYPDAEHIRVDIKATKKTESPLDRNIIRQYGINVLPEASCPADRNPETFGGGHEVWPPAR